MPTFDIQLLSLPNSPNKSRREHWSVRAEQVKQCRESTGMQALSAMRALREFPAREPRTLAIEVVRGKTGGNLLDLDNCISQLKAAIDGIKDAGWLKDDSPKWLTALSVSQRKDMNERGIRLRVTVEKS